MKLKLSLYRAFSFDNLMFYAIQIIFLTNVKNFDISDVLLLESFYWGCQIFLQIPTPYIIDKLGNKKSSILGSLCWIIAILLYLVSSSIWYIIIGEFVRALGASILGTVSTPITYQLLKKNKLQRKYKKIEGNAVFLYFLIDSFLSFISGFVFNVNSYLPMFVVLLTCVVAFILSCSLDDVPNEDTVKPTFKDYKKIIKNKFVVSILLYSFFVGAILSLPASYNKVFLVDIGISPEWLGIIISLLTLVNALSAKFSDEISKIFKDKTITMISVICLSSFVLLGILYFYHNLITLIILILPIFIVQNTLKQPYRIYLKYYINEKVPSRYITRVLSIYFIIENIGRTLLLFIVGICAKLYSVGTIYIFVGILTLIPVCLATKRMNENL